MKKKNLSIFGAFFLLLFFSCDQQLDHAPPASGNASFAAFGGASARAYFEATATDLAPLSFSDRVEARTSGLELIPEWDKVSESGNGQVSLVEIPLSSNSVNIGTVTFTENGKIVCQKFFISRRRLVIARRSSGETDMFVVTLIPSVMAEGNPEKNMDNFRYLDGGGFIGQAFCSTLGGRFVEAWEYEPGKRFPIGVLSARTLAAMGGNPAGAPRETIGFREMVQTRGGAYATSETLPPLPELPSLEPPVDTVDMDGVVVHICQGCGRDLTSGERCYCRNCQRCTRYPCICAPVCQECCQNPCAKCSNCGHHYCYGTCRGGIGGGGISGGGGGGGSSGGGGGVVNPGGNDQTVCSLCGKRPCVCCPQCKGPCKCSGCHKNPCVCCPGEKCPDCGGTYPWSVPETRSASPCPLCLCWNKDTHHEIIDSLAQISGLDAAWVEEFKKANKWCDNLFGGNQATSKAYIHAMNTVKGQSPAEAQRIFENHLRTELNRFVDEKDVHSLGIAIHGITDSFCPSHEGFQFIRLVSGKIIEHTKWDKGKNSPEAVRTATNCASGVIGIMKEGKPDRVERAIDYWRTSYQNNLNNR